MFWEYLHRLLATPSPVLGPAVASGGSKFPMLGLFQVFLNAFSRVFELWAECSLFGVKLKDTRTEKPYRIPVESSSNL